MATTENNSGKLTIYTGGDEDYAFIPLDVSEDTSYGFANYIITNDACTYVKKIKQDSSLYNLVKNNIIDTSAIRDDTITITDNENYMINGYLDNYMLNHVINLYYIENFKYTLDVSQYTIENNENLTVQGRGSNYMFTITPKLKYDSSNITVIGSSEIPPDNTYIVTWDFQGGNINDDTSNKTESVESGSTVEFNTYKPTKTGYTFVGWSTDKSATSGSMSGNSDPITANITFYAIWKSNTTYTVIWVLQGGNINGDTASKQNIVEHGGTVSFSTYTPTKDDYTFIGWNTDGTATTGSTSGTYTVTEHIVFYAIWKESIRLNMSPVKLDPSSTKKIPAIADILYSTDDGKLTLDAQTNSVNNTAIAICVIPDVIENFENGDNSAGAVKTARFVSLNYMNYDTPTTGNVNESQSMYFGNYGTRIGNDKGGITKNSYVGGKRNTQQCLFKATKDKNSVSVTNNSGAGYCAPAWCCARYSTSGTKPGDWYLPSVGELYQIYANKTTINEKRTALVGSGFIGSGYWSSRENGSNDEYCVSLDNGIIIFANKNYNLYVLSFLALEV